MRPVVEGDRPRVVAVARQLVRDGRTYAFDPAVTDDELWHYWAPGAPAHGWVATVDGRVVGMFVIRPNHPGPGSHVANASYAVDAAFQGRGIGRQLGRASLWLAAELGHQAMQFNIVVSTNAAALALWRSLGFRVVGTIPEGFTLPDGARVDHHILYRTLGAAHRSMGSPRGRTRS